MIYVDWLMNYGWKMYGKSVESCHMFSDTNNVDELKEFAVKMGLKLSWLQKSRDGLFHFDLVKSKRKIAIESGAEEISKEKFLEVHRNLRTQNKIPKREIKL